MPLPIPNLDDRRFDDLVAEAKARLANHLPELTQIAPGDPVHAVVDLFAHFTETILFRANLIPERQRRVVLNLLQVPIRNAKAAKGVVCIDGSPRDAKLPALVRDGAQLRAGQQPFTVIGELQPTPLAMTVAIKKAMSIDELSALKISLRELKEQYGIKRGDTPTPFQPKHYELGKDTMALSESLDKYFYMALTVSKNLRSELSQVRDNLAGIILNVAIAPADDVEGEEISSLSPRKLVWELLTADEEGEQLNLPLEVVDDSSQGGRRAGVVRLRLPENAALFDGLVTDDPMFAGFGDQPPELPDTISSDRVAFWLRMTCPDEPDLSLGYLDVNGVDAVGQGLKRDLLIGVGNGQPDQVINFPDQLIEPKSLQLQVEEDGAWVTWQQVDFLLGHSGKDRIYRLEAISGVVYFGDGLEGGKRPPKGKRIRVANYLYGGGSRGNVSAGEIKELVNGGTGLQLRHLWSFQDGVNAETVAQAERRIPQYLSHRNRAVTKVDCQLLVENNPINPVAKAEVLEGFLPGANINAARFNVPGIISIFVLPPRFPALRQTPKPSKALLKDVFEYMLPRMVIGTELYVLSPEYIPIAVGVNVEVLDPKTEQETLQAVQSSLVNYLWPLVPGGARGRGWAMGVNVNANELEAQVARVDGVRAVKTLSIFHKRSDSTTRREKRWRRLNDNEVVTLQAYQLPELLGVSVGTGDGAPSFPSGLETEPNSGRNVPAPVIPDVC